MAVDVAYLQRILEVCCSYLVEKPLIEYITATRSLLSTNRASFLHYNCRGSTINSDTNLRKHPFISSYPTTPFPMDPTCIIRLISKGFTQDKKCFLINSWPIWLMGDRPTLVFPAFLGQCKWESHWKWCYLMTNVLWNSQHLTKIYGVIVLLYLDLQNS